MAEWLTPSQIASSRHIRLAKIFSWIRSGQLRAVNLAEAPNGRPRWRISEADLAAFEESRSNRLPSSGGRSRRVRDDLAEVRQYF